MIIKKLGNFINESNNKDLKYYAFDWDDNILHMSTVIHLDHLVDGEWVPEDVSTSKFADVRTDTQNWRRREDSFFEFRDFGPRGIDAFLLDAIDAIEKGNFGPSWNAFINCLSSGSIFSIITARGQSSQAIKKAVEYVIDTQLDESQKHTLYAHCLKFGYLFSNPDSYDRIPKGKLSQTNLIQDYLNDCDFYGISSDEFIQKFGLGDASNPELAKKLAIKAFTEKIHGFGKKLSKGVSLGFSDDDPGNINAIETVFTNELALRYVMKFNIYDTSNKGYQKRKILREGQSSFGMGANTWGKDSSVLPFTKWNSMGNNFYPSGKDMPNDDYHNQLKNQLGQIKDLSSDITKKKLLKNGKHKKFRKLHKRRLPRKD